MISIIELSNYKILMVIREYLEKISSRYSHVEGLANHIMKIIALIQKTANEMLGPIGIGENNSKPSSGISSEIEFSKSEMIQSLYKFKEQIRADDWLFLKASLAQDEKEFASIISLAQAISPENEYFFLFICSLIDDNKFNLDNYIKMLPYFHFSPNDKALSEFLSLSELHLFPKTQANEQSRKKILRLVESIDFIYTGRFYFLLHLINTLNPELMLYVLSNISAKKKWDVEFYSLLEGIIYNRINNFNETVKKLQMADIDSLPIEDWEKIEYTGMLAKAYQALGNKGKAILVWKSILDGNENALLGHLSYYEAVINVSSYYLSINKLADAKNTLFNIPKFITDNLIEETGADYFALVGDIFFAEGKYKDALDNYRKSFDITPSFKLIAKIQWLEQTL